MTSMRFSEKQATMHGIFKKTNHNIWDQYKQGLESDD